MAKRTGPVEPYEWDELATRAAVAGRSGGICESCCAARATDMHHRKNRSQGGEWTPANIINICRACHNHIGTNPKTSYLSGLSLLSHQEPETIPVKRHTGEVLFLSDDVAPPLRKRRR